MSYRNLAAPALAAALTLALLAGPLASPAYAGTEERVETPSLIDATLAWIVEALGFSAGASEKGGTFVIPGGQPTDSDPSSDGDTLTSEDSAGTAEPEAGPFVDPFGQPTDSGPSSDGDTLTSDDSEPSADTEGGAFVSPGG